MQTNNYRRLLYAFNGNSSTIMVPNLGSAQHRFIARTIITTDNPDKPLYIMCIDFHTDGIDRRDSLRMVGEDSHVHYLGEFDCNFTHTGTCQILETDGTPTTDNVTGYVELDICAGVSEPLRLVLEQLRR